MFKKRKANKKIDRILAEWTRAGRKGSARDALGMTHAEFQEWCSTGNPPKRFL